jgi:predicted transcriptional regulator
LLEEQPARTIADLKAHPTTTAEVKKVGEAAMAEQGPASRIDRIQVVRIVSSYLRHHRVAPDQVAALIVEVHRAVAGLGRAPPAQEPLQPAVPIRRSVQQDYVVCLECGYRAQTLRRHLLIAHGLSVAEYRIRWKLPIGYPVVAPAYSARRSTIAKKSAFWRRAAAQPSPRRTEQVPAAPQPGTRRRGRRPRRPPTT